MRNFDTNNDPNFNNNCTTCSQAESTSNSTPKKRPIQLALDFGSEKETVHTQPTDDEETRHSTNTRLYFDEDIFHSVMNFASSNTEYCIKLEPIIQEDTRHFLRHLFTQKINCELELNYFDAVETYPYSLGIFIQEHTLDILSELITNENLGTIELEIYIRNEKVKCCLMFSPLVLPSLSVREL